VRQGELHRHRGLAHTALPCNALHHTTLQ
jgi:hypothetical protein